MVRTLTVAETEDFTGNNVRELLLGPVKHIGSGILKIPDHFYEHDTKGKKHTCLIFRVLGSSVEDLVLSNLR